MATIFGVSLLVAVVAGGSYLYRSLGRMERDLERYNEREGTEDNDDNG